MDAGELHAEEVVDRESNRFAVVITHGLAIGMANRSFQKVR